jgi:hypothetical protein
MDNELNLAIRITRLPRDKCFACRMRRILYQISVVPLGALPEYPGQTIVGVSRCAKCLGIGR